MRRALITALLTISMGLALSSSASAFEWLDQYGVGYSSGSEGGVLGSSTYGISAAPDGTVVVADSSNSRVSIFSQSGKFLRAFGKNVSFAPGEGPEVCTTDCTFGSSGSAAGEMSSPHGVLATAGEIYVADYNNQRVSVFNYEGHFLRAFGKDVGGPGVNTCTATCLSGLSGGESGQMDYPSGLGLDAAGELLISESSSSRVDVYNPQTGQFLRAFGKGVGGPGVNICTTVCTYGEGGIAPGALSSAYGLTVGPNDEVFVAEASNSRISVFSTAGQFLRTFGSIGNGAGNLSSPNGVAVAPDGSVYVADTFNSRLSVFDTSGQFKRAFGENVNGFNTGAGSCSGPCQSGTTGYGIGAFSTPYGVATDCRGAVYISGYGRVDKYGEPGARTPPCPSNAFSFGKASANKKKGTLSVEVSVSGPGSLSASAGAKVAATAPQPAAAGVVNVVLKATGKGVKGLAKSGKLKGTLSVTFTPPNGDPNTQTKSVQLAKTVKKHKKTGKHKGGGKRA